MQSHTNGTNIFVAKQICIFLDVAAVDIFRGILLDPNILVQMETEKLISKASMKIMLAVILFDQLTKLELKRIDTYSPQVNYY